MGYALITGASSGVGAQFSIALANLGYDLVLVARGADRLTRVGTAISEQTGRQCEILAADLSTSAGLARVEQRLAGQTDPIEFLVNNAGFGTKGDFLSNAVAEEQDMLNVNVTAVMRLCHAALPGMIERGRGDIINVASVAAYIPSDSGPGYGASKAYVVSLTDSLAVSLEGTGVHISVLSPGFVHTEFHQRLEMDTTWIPSWLWLEAPRVVSDSLDAHLAGRHSSIPAKRYKAVVTLAKIVPRTTLRKVLIKARDLQRARHS
ncbi:MAG: SDR family oxidoreductase [Antricoccus sp.]